jgi:23S rRNA (guanosine2251-2'-O)-methyltransferase
MKSKFIYGFHSVNSLLLKQQDAVEIVYIDDKRQDKRIIQVLELVKQANLNYKLVTTSQLDKLCTNSKHQGVAIELVDSYATQQALNLPELIEQLSLKDNSVIVALDGVTDPHNLGAIIRSCDCFAVDAVLIPKDNSASVNATVAKVSAGAINHIPVIEVNNLVRSLEQLQEAGYWVAGTTLAERSVDLFAFQPDKKMVWVMGSEDVGIRRLVAETCDYLVTIPMAGNTQSLNVSVATGVVLSYTRYCSYNK